MSSFWETERIRLRAMEPDDVPFFRQFEGDEFMVRRVSQIRAPESAVGLRNWVEQDAKKENKDDRIDLMIESLDGQPAGFINTFNLNPRAGSFFYAIALLEAYRRRGFGRDALTLVLRYYFGELRYQRCTAIVYDYNEPSQRFHESMGFVREGVMRRDGFANGKHFDTCIYGLLVEDFKDTL